MAIEGESRKKRILFVYRDYPTSATLTFSIVMDLSEEYDVQTHPGLDDTVIETIRQAASNRKFDAIITHVPFKHKPFENLSVEHLHHILPSIFYSERYGRSLDILAIIKKIQDIPIIAYTGADNCAAIYSLFMEAGGVDYIIHKHSYAEDERKIHEVLSHLLQKYESPPQIIECPVLAMVNGYTNTTVNVLLNGGIGWISLGAIIEECSRYPGKVWFKRDDLEDAKPRDGKNSFDIVQLCISEGDYVTILVEGEDKKAQKLARRLYSILTSRYAFNINFERFEK